MLAYQSEEVIKRVARQIERHTDRTVSSAKELMNDLNRIRQIGYSMNRANGESLSEEWRCR